MNAVKLVQTKTLVPVILSGGMGTRLWPLSRSNFPKQFLNLSDPNLSLIQQTIHRVQDKARFAPPVVVCNQDHRFLVAQTLTRTKCTNAKIILEPSARNTAPALAAAAHYIASQYDNAYMLVLPSDHIIGDTKTFLAGVEQAFAVAQKGHLTTFGITPSGPETGFGYIKSGNTISDTEGFAIEQFVEKPDVKTAESYLANGGYTWNSGMFLFPVDLFLSELKAYQPEISSASESVARNRVEDTDFIRLDSKLFSTIPSLSIDYAVMEHTKKAAVVPLTCGWNDAGAWDALWQTGAKDETGNVQIGESFNLDTQDCLIHCEEGVRIATLGVKDLVIVSTKDCVLVADKSRAQDVKKLVDMVKVAKPELVDRYRQEYRPWGHYDSIDMGERFQVKRITVRPGAQLSLQMHYHRAEHWIVVSGTAHVVRNDETHVITENQSIYIPSGARHRIENPGKIPLEIIEVQSGSYLGEDDIVRFDDTYGRTTATKTA